MYNCYVSNSRNKIFKIVNKKIYNYYKRMRFLQKRLSKTIAFILYKLKLVSNMVLHFKLLTKAN
jgi:hypothetical protein